MIRLEEIIEEARSYLFNLEEGWDEEGAEVIDRKSFANLVNFLYAYHIRSYIEPFIGPSNCGGVSLEYNSIDRLTCLIVFFKPNSTDYQYYGHSSSEKGKYENEINDICRHGLVNIELDTWMLKFLRK